jgi:hypothetical protein
VQSKDINAGAASALAYISQQELTCRQDVLRLKQELDKAMDEQRTQPPEKDGFDFDKAVGIARRNLDDAEDRHFKFLKNLREFDKSVAPDKRDASESITQSEGVKVFGMMAIYLRTANESFIDGLSQSILEECKTPEDIHRMIATKLRENVVNSVTGAIRETHLPAWTIKAVEDVL